MTPGGEEKRGVERNRWIHDLIWCGECGCHVAVFRDLAAPEQEITDRWKREPPHYPEVAEATGLDLWRAKSWVLHLEKRIKQKGSWNSTGCPHCG